MIKIVNLKQKSSDLYKTGQLYKQNKIGHSSISCAFFDKFWPPEQEEGEI